MSQSLMSSAHGDTAPNSYGMMFAIRGLLIAWRLKFVLTDHSTFLGIV